MAEKDFLKSIEEEIESHMEALDIGKTTCDTIRIPVKDGKGSVTSEKRKTAWIKIKGTFHIKSPSEGTWEVTVTDIANKNKIVYHGKDLKCCVEYKIGEYKTGWQCQLKIDVVWSEKKDTTLVAEVCVTI